ncbi:MAG: hypothetical protein M1816_003455 [Peltula sp. TS41687]|nr:MAG: hypothetical protein M1816_003455 [Peltula sp. TS41687]
MTTTTTAAWLAHREHLPTANGCTGNRLAFTFAIMLMLTWIPTTFGQELTNVATMSSVTSCARLANTSDSYAQSNFRIKPWMERGICIRGNRSHCYDTLETVLLNLTEVRKSEYAGAAGVLSLLPTIGALLGAPSNEIWRLLSIIPFGGALAMALSFGGAIMPVKVEDYEHAINKRDIAIGNIISLKNNYISGQGEQETIDDKLRLLVDRVRQRIDQRESARLSKKYLTVGLAGMVLLLFGAQAAMTVVQLGGVVAWICSNRWWMHLWYFMVTFTAVTENYVQLPFIETYKFYISSVAYHISTVGGESIIDYFKEGKAADNVAIALHQLNTLKTAHLTIRGSRQYTRSRNSVMVMVSVAGDTRFGSLWRLLSKSLSIGVYVTGTALFASVTLLSLQMAVLVLTLNLSAGVFGRAIAGWVVSRVSETEPIIHVISHTRHEAYQAVAEILCIRSDDGTPFQVEVNGHIFLDQRRVVKRSWWPVAFLGVIAEPYDLRKACHPVSSSMGEDHSPFLGMDPNVTRKESVAEVHLRSLRSRSHESTASNTGRSTGGERHHVTTEPTPSFTRVSLGES